MIIYDETSATFLRWTSGKRKGQEAGGLTHEGYFRVKIAGKELRSHRVIWEMFNGSVPHGMVVDHIDGNPKNNSISNLRLASYTQNNYNKIKVDNKELPKGICISRNAKGYSSTAFKASIRVPGGKRLSKTSKDISVLEQWLSEMREKYHGEFSCDGTRKEN